MAELLEKLQNREGKNHLQLLSSKKT
ncbi:uncharacterized protein METZ01_LOCUS244007 [marine metagenome]|uniref:Uncharacterized protein n=1 Tax=marine metagenome TaxID=408172 RepID=A0A382HX04_9ZZZZ